MDLLDRTRINGPPEPDPPALLGPHTCKGAGHAQGLGVVRTEATNLEVSQDVLWQHGTHLGKSGLSPGTINNTPDCYGPGLQDIRNPATALFP